MLRDRCPKLVIFALKWCKATNAWLDHVYKSWIWMYASNKERLNATKNILGYDENKRQFEFEDTIDWNNLSFDETIEWKKISAWVSWFVKCYDYVKNDYDISLKVGKSIQEVKYDIMIKYLSDMCPTAEDSTEVRQEKNKYINNFVDFLIDCFENRIK